MAPVLSKPLMLDVIRRSTLALSDDRNNPAGIILVVVVVIAGTAIVYLAYRALCICLNTRRDAQVSPGLETNGVLAIQDVENGPGTSKELESGPFVFVPADVVVIETTTVSTPPSTTITPCDADNEEEPTLTTLDAGVAEVMSSSEINQVVEVPKSEISLPLISVSSNPMEYCDDIDDVDGEGSIEDCREKECNAEADASTLVYVPDDIVVHVNVSLDKIVDLEVGLQTCAVKVEEWASFQDDDSFVDSVDLNLQACIAMVDEWSAQGDITVERVASEVALPLIPALSSGLEAAKHDEDEPSETTNDIQGSGSQYYDASTLIPNPLDLFAAASPASGRKSILGPTEHDSDDTGEDDGFDAVDVEISACIAQVEQWQFRVQAIVEAAASEDPPTMNLEEPTKQSMATVMHTQLSSPRKMVQSCSRSPRKPLTNISANIPLRRSSPPKPSKSTSPTKPASSATPATSLLRTKAPRSTSLQALAVSPAATFKSWSVNGSTINKSVSLSSSSRPSKFSSVCPAKKKVTATSPPPPVLDPSPRATIFTIPEIASPPRAKHSLFTKALGSPEFQGTVTSRFSSSRLTKSVSIGTKANIPIAPVTVTRPLAVWS